MAAVAGPGRSASCTCRFDMIEEAVKSRLKRARAAVREKVIATESEIA